MPSAHPSPLHDALVVSVALATLLAIGFGRAPGLRLNRAAVAVAGAGATAAIEGWGAATLWRVVDGRVLLLLFSLMVVNAALSDAGLFRLVTLGVAAGRVQRTALLVAVVLAAGILSALFLNDAVALMLTPSVIELSRRLEAPPEPYLLGLAMAANAGSAATLTGNPQNVVVGVASGIGYLPFAAALAPVAAAALATVALALLALYRRELRGSGTAADTLTRPSVHPYRLASAGLATAGMLAAFVAGVPAASAAFAAAAALLVVSGSRAGELLRSVDFELLALFAGLFVVVAALGSTAPAVAALAWAERGGTAALAAAAALASNVVSNVPAVLLLLPATQAAAGGSRAALTLAMASTLAGNLTLLGSIANLIVVETARRLGVEIGFRTYARAGVPVALVTLALGIVWLALR